MKVTVALPDSLVQEAERYAVRSGIPLQEVFARALRVLLRRPATTRQPFRLKTVTTKGEGLAVDGNWTEILSLRERQEINIPVEPVRGRIV